MHMHMIKINTPSLLLKLTFCSLLLAVSFTPIVNAACPNQQGFDVGWCNEYGHPGCYSNFTYLCGDNPSTAASAQCPQNCDTGALGGFGDDPDRICPDNGLGGGTDECCKRECRYPCEFECENHTNQALEDECKKNCRRAEVACWTTGQCGGY